MDKKNYSVDNICTADLFSEMTCRNYKVNPFEHRYKICFFRGTDRTCKHIKPERYKDELRDEFFSKDVEASNEVAQCFDGTRLFDGKGREDE
jgi:hypothetical protein